MKKLSAVSRADLLRQLDESGGLASDHAGFFGYIGQVVTATQNERNELARTTSAQEPDSIPELPPKIEFPDEIPRLKFLICQGAETLHHEPAPRPTGNPITDAELAVPWGKPRAAVVPLIRWARLAPWMRRCLGKRVIGSRLHLRRLLQQVGDGLPVCTLPYLSRQAWVPQAIILSDETPEMAPFQRDIEFAIQRLRRERGLAGLTRLRLRGLAQLLFFSPPTGVPVLALSSLGQYGDNVAFREAWIKLGHRLAFRGHSLQALCPIPRGLWRRDVAQSWPAVQWDRRPRLPRYGHHTPIPGIHPDSEMVENLLDLLSPAARVEVSLLRATRLLLGPAADVGHEYAAWNHPDVDPSPECFCFLNEIRADRLRRRAKWAKRQPGFVHKIDLLIQQHLQSCSPALATETFLRTLRELPHARSFLQRCVDRLREETAVNTAGVGSGLGAWFPLLVDGLPPEVRAHDEIASLIAQGLALANTYNRTPHTTVPDGVDPDDYVAECRVAAETFSSPVDYRVQQQKDSVFLQPGSVIESNVAKLRPIAFLSAGSSALHLSRVDESLESFQLPFPSSNVRLGSLSVQERFTLESDRQRLHFVPIERPAWARRMAYDRFGVFADFKINGAPFVMRWIPPGKFLMGSPKNEPGRRDNEGPQHEVTISRGYWLAETPVTQAQWKAIATQDGSNLESDPSHFKGPPELPVESITWHQAQAYCKALTRLFKDRLPAGFSWYLPTEAQWEYACRAGEKSALYSGEIEIKGTNNAPAIDLIGWYGGNSGIDLELSNPENSDWPDMQFTSEMAGTHKVKLKMPNRFGVYDMIGNVLEWCHDGIRNYEEQPEQDPVGRTSDASRVVRGGAWDFAAQGCRSAYRYASEPGSRWGIQGLRLAAGQPPEARK